MYFTQNNLSDTMETAPSKKAGTLYVVGTPIGNQQDITLRALETLRFVEVLACEERREGERLCRRIGIEKELIEINEHTERENAGILIEILRNGRSVALVSDCGMPVIADPGSFVIGEAIGCGIHVEIVPGITSVTTALAACGFDAKRFFYYGFLSAKKEKRRGELLTLKNFPHPLVFLDTPYRLRQVLEDIAAAFGPSRNACVACDLTTRDEIVRRGALSELLRFFSAQSRKFEFVIVVQGAEKK